MPAIRYLERPPHDRLQSHIECFWSVRTETEIVNHVFPDGCVDLVYSPLLGLQMTGLMTARQSFPLPAGSSVIGVRFRPGVVASLLGISPSEIVDRSVSASSVLPRPMRDCEDRLRADLPFDRSIEILERYLLPLPRPLNPTQRALLDLTRHRGLVRIDDLARHANLSERQFRRACHAEIGLSPKLLSRILRFRHARELAWSTPTPNWAHVAAQAGYFDGAHLVRDFTEFADGPPTLSDLYNTAA